MIPFAIAPGLPSALCILAAIPVLGLAVFKSDALTYQGTPNDAWCLDQPPLQDGDVASFLQLSLKGAPTSRIDGHGNSVDSHRPIGSGSRSGSHRFTTYDMAHVVTEVAIVIGALIACSVTLMAIWAFYGPVPGEARLQTSKRSSPEVRSIPGSSADSAGGLSDLGQNSDIDSPEVTSLTRKNIKGALLDKLETTSIHSASSTASSERDDDPGYGTILWSFLVFGPVQWIVILAFTLTWIMVQFWILPFRLCGGRLLTFVQHLFGPLMSSLTFIFVTTNHGESCYGRLIGNFRAYEDFLQKCSASRRKNIKRNSTAAKKEIENLGIHVSYFPAGSWRITSEICSVIWHQCTRHNERAHGHADIMNCSQPVSPSTMYLGEMLFLLAFPCDIQLFRTQDHKLVSLNTRVHIGNVYFNPNYATLEEYSQIGIYAWANMDIMQEAIRLRTTVVNVMPSMRSAKRAVGLRKLRLASLIGASFTCSREAREEANLKPVVAAKSNIPLGGKRAARKRAARDAS